MKQSELYKLEIVSKKLGISTKKILDMFYLLRNREIENTQLLKELGVSKNVINQIKKEFCDWLSPVSSKTSLSEKGRKKIAKLFEPGYFMENDMWGFIKSFSEFKIVHDFLKTAYPNHVIPNRKLDQFTATTETIAKRAVLMNFFGDITNKQALFLGDNDFTSIGFALLQHKEKNLISVLEYDDRIITALNNMSQKNGFHLQAELYDARNVLPDAHKNRYDVVFIDPPYTPNGINLYLSRAISSINRNNNSARIYLCYGNSDRAKERFIPIYEILAKSGLMIRWVFDKFNQYDKAESIGSTSTLFVCEITPKSKPLLLNKFEDKIYTNE